jgi:hypothetical protein
VLQKIRGVSLYVQRTAQRLKRAAYIVEDVHVCTDHAKGFRIACNSSFEKAVHSPGRGVVGVLISG